MSGLPTFFQKVFSSYGNAPKIKESVTLPAQASQSGKFLKTDGTSTSWDSVDALPSQSGQSGKFLTTDGSTASWGNVPEYSDATTSAHGLMSASDKSKLNGIQDGAQVNAVTSVNGQTGAVTVSTSISWSYRDIGFVDSQSSKTFTGFTVGKLYMIGCASSSRFSDDFDYKFTLVSGGKRLSIASFIATSTSVTINNPSDSSRYFRVAEHS